MSEDAVFCSKCGCKFIEPEETDEIIKDTADKTEISSKQLTSVLSGFVKTKKGYNQGGQYGR